MAYEIIAMVSMCYNGTKHSVLKLRVTFNLSPKVEKQITDIFLYMIPLFRNWPSM